jgi:hypothetical protein
MKSGEEILDTILAGGPGCGATTEEYRAEAVAVIESAQREAWNEALELAVAKIESFNCPTLFKRLPSAIRSLHREEE